MTINLADQLNQLTDHINAVNNVIDKADVYTKSDYQKTLEGWSNNLKTYDPKTEFSGTENPYLDEGTIRTPVLNQGAKVALQSIANTCRDIQDVTTKFEYRDLAEGDSVLSPLTKMLPSADELHLSQAVDTAIKFSPIFLALNATNEIINKFADTSIGKPVFTYVANTRLFQSPAIKGILSDAKAVDDILQSIPKGIGNYAANSYDYAREHPVTTAFDIALAYETGAGFGQAVEGTIGGLEIAADMSKVTEVLTPYIRPAAMGALTGQLGAQAVETALQGSIDKDLDFVTQLAVGGAGYGKGARSAEGMLKTGEDVIGKISDKFKSNTIKPETSTRGFEFYKNTEPDLLTAGQHLDYEMGGQGDEYYRAVNNPLKEVSDQMRAVDLVTKGMESKSTTSNPYIEALENIDLSKSDLYWKNNHPTYEPVDTSAAVKLVNRGMNIPEEKVPTTVAEITDFNLKNHENFRNSVTDGYYRAVNKPMREISDQLQAVDLVTKGMEIHENKTPYVSFRGHQ